MNLRIIALLVVLVAAAGLGVYWYIQVTSVEEAAPTNPNTMTNEDTSPVPSAAPEPQVATEPIASQSGSSAYLPAWQDVSVTYKGEVLSYQRADFEPPLRYSEVAAGDRSTVSPVQALALRYSLLAKGDIESAAQQTAEDPAADIKAMTAYKERVGDDVFKGVWGGLLSPDSEVRAVALLKTSDAVVVLNADGDLPPGANVLTQTDGGYRLVDGMDGSISAGTISIINHARSQDQ